MGRLLVTGASGFVGVWVLRHWQARHPDVEVWATSDQPRPPEAAEETFRRLDLCDAEAVAGLVREVRPTEVIHLAARIRADSLADYLAVNVLGTENLYRALAADGAAADVRVVQAGSAAIYGKVRPEDLPIGEDRPLAPVTPYALSKAAQDELACLTHPQAGLGVVRARIFNMIGPGQPENLVPMAFVQQLAAVRNGQADRLLVGNVEPRRDFLDVRDVVGALDALLGRGGAGCAYNVGSGRDVAIGELVTMLLEVEGLEVPVEVDPSRVRPVDVACVRADVSRIRKATGWQAGIGVRESLRAMWESVNEAGPSGNRGVSHG